MIWLVFLACAVIGVLFQFIRCSLWRRKYCQLLPGSKPWFFDILADAKDLIVYNKSGDKYCIHHRKGSLSVIKSFNNSQVGYKKDKANKSGFREESSWLQRDTAKESRELANLLATYVENDYHSSLEPWSACCGRQIEAGQLKLLQSYQKCSAIYGFETDGVAIHLRLEDPLKK
ncbi:hypothetical protein TNCV_461071 [Trichonephila clavipes]|nr:hypothetical protein TNCV_461071 [Trichonephila clavipes]